MVGVLLGVLAGVLVGGCGGDPAVRLPPPGSRFDYQIGGDHDPAPGVGVVSRDWFAGAPLPGGYSLCYVNAFQTEADDDAVQRPDERSAWPAHLVLDELGDDPQWGGEYLLDIGTAVSRAEVVDRIEPMIDVCAEKGFDAVELDNLDSWTRFDGTPVGPAVPFGRREAVLLAADLAGLAHDRGLAVAQKNTPQLSRREALGTVGFDLAVAEQCGTYDECAAYTDLYGRAVLDVEYDDEGFERACGEVGDRIAVVRRDVAVSTPGYPSHVSRWCEEP